MKKRNLLKTTLLLAAMLTTSLFAEEKIGDGFIAGSVGFLDKSGREAIVVISAGEKAYLLNKGVLLVIKRGTESVVLKITESEGKFLKCIIDSGKDNAVLLYNENVYYYDSMNGNIKYRDAKRILSELIKLYEDFIRKIESTEDPAVISAVVNSFSSELEKLIPEMKRINSKYPELEKFNSTPPVELQNESAALGILEPRLKEAFFKINMFGTDANVKKSIDNLQKVLMNMNTGR